MGCTNTQARATCGTLYLSTIHTKKGGDKPNKNSALFDLYSKTILLNHNYTLTYWLCIERSALKTSTDKGSNCPYFTIGGLHAWLYMCIICLGTKCTAMLLFFENQCWHLFIHCKQPLPVPLWDKKKQKSNVGEKAAITCSVYYLFNICFFHLQY